MIILIITILWIIIKYNFYFKTFALNINGVNNIWEMVCCYQDNLFNENSYTTFWERFGMSRGLRRLLVVTYGALFVWTLFLVFGLHNIWRVSCSKVFPLENAGFFIIGVSIIVFLLIINYYWGSNIDSFLQKHYRVVLSVSLLLLFGYQLYTCYGGYFQSGWDAGRIRNTVFLEFTRGYSRLDHGYFSWFPNNILIVGLFKGVTRLSSFLGYSNWEYSLVVFQCLIDTFTIWLVYKVTFEFSKSQKVSFLSYLLAYLFVGISPWFIVAYSDATGFMFPVLIIRLYQLAKGTDSKLKEVVWWNLLGLTSVVGFLVKPQTFIAFIAVVLIEICCLRKNEFKRLLPNFLKMIFCMFAGITFFVISYNLFILPSTRLQLNPNTTVGWQHFLMMGLNGKRDGVWSGDDYSFTFSFKVNKERNKANLKQAIKRIKEFGTRGLLRHLCRKQLVNYGDGTFAWNVEGHFFLKDPDWANNRSSKLVRSFIKPRGKNYKWFISQKQLIWVVVLFFQLFVFLYPRKELDDVADRTVNIMATSIIGLTVFELLFEARARYLFCYAPIFVILSGWGIRNTYRIAIDGLQKTVFQSMQKDVK